MNVLVTTLRSLHAVGIPFGDLVSLISLTILRSPLPNSLGITSSMARLYGAAISGSPIILNYHLSWNLGIPIFCTNEEYDELITIDLDTLIDIHHANQEHRP